MAALTLFIDSVDAELSVRRLRVSEAISRLFELQLVFRSPAVDLDLDRIAEATALVSITMPTVPRKWSGVVQQIKQIDVEPAGLSTYECTIVPALSILATNNDYRVFERCTIIDIIDQILDARFIHYEWRIDNKSFPSLEYRVQYGESDYHFISRLAEEAGISFFFEHHEPRGSVLILTDDPSRAKPIAGPSLTYLNDTTGADSLPFATRVLLRRDRDHPRSVIRDVDFRRPDYPLYGEGVSSGDDGAALPRYEFAPGSSRIYTVHPPAYGALPSKPKAPGRHDPRVGNEIAARRDLAEAIRTRRVRFETNSLDLAPGAIVPIVGHPHPWLGAAHPLLVTHFVLDAEQNKEWCAQCDAVFADRAFKPRLTTRRPIVRGLQTAIVQGPEGQDVAADEYGRVKVRFFWSRIEGEESCWLRVAQNWAGPGYGLRTIPRVGQEVLVGFLEGNPDEPLVVGQLPNAKMPAPYPLPANQTKTVFRTRSTGEGDGHNELSFEDRQGEELLYVRAERDKETLVRGNDRERIEGSRHELVGGDEHLTIKGNRREDIRGNEHLAIAGDARTKIDGNASLSVGGGLFVDIGGPLSVRVEGKVVVVSLAQLVLAAADATVQSKGAFVRATPGTVYVSPVVLNAGVSGGGAAITPDLPEAPMMPAAYSMFMPDGKVHLPVIGWVGGIPQVGSVPDDVLICRFICECENALKADGTREPQNCYVRKMRLYETAARGVTHIWTEVPYDMSQSPPTPIMSRNEPWRQTGSKPKGSKIPDNVIVKDPKLPPTQDNIEKIIEVKFPPDDWSEGQLEAYEKIAGGAPVQKWGPGDPCYCSDQEKPQPRKVPEPAPVLAAALIVAVIVACLLDDVAGGFADDALIPPLVVELLKQLAPLFKTMPLVP